MYSVRFKKFLVLLAVLLIVFSVAACSQNSDSKDSASEESSDTYVKKVVANDLVDRANQALDSIGKIADAEKKSEIAKLYDDLNDALLSRDEEGVKQNLAKIEPKIEEAMSAQDPNAKSEQQVLEKAKEIEASAASLTDEEVKKRAVEAYNRAKQIYGTGDMGKTWEALIYVEDIIKAESITNEVIMERYNQVKTLGAQLKDEELIQKISEKLKEAEGLYGSGDLKNAWLLLLEADSILTGGAAPSEETDKTDPSNAESPSQDEIIKKAGDIKAAVLALKDGEQKDKLTAQYANAEDAFKAGNLEEAWNILLQMEEQLK